MSLDYIILQCHKMGWSCGRSCEHILKWPRVFNGVGPFGFSSFQGNVLVNQQFSLLSSTNLLIYTFRLFCVECSNASILIASTYLYSGPCMGFLLIGFKWRFSVLFSKYFPHLSLALSFGMIEMFRFAVCFRASSSGPEVTERWRL